MTRLPLAARLGAATLLLGLALASCAPRPTAPPELTRDTRRERYLRMLEDREARAGFVEADATLWGRSARSGSLPGVQAWLGLATPDAFRLRVESLFGTAIDLSARGDSLVAYVPARRQGTALDAARDPLGLRNPGSIGYRVLAVGWRPPEDAWESATWDDSLLVVRWQEGRDSLSLGVGATGRAAWARLSRRDGNGVTARYPAWTRAENVDWPARIEFEDDERAFQVSCRVQRVRFPARSDPSRLVARIPADAERLDWNELHDLVRRILED